MPRSQSSAVSIEDLSERVKQIHRPEGLRKGTVEHQIRNNTDWLRQFMRVRSGPVLCQSEQDTEEKEHDKMVCGGIASCHINYAKLSEESHIMEGY